MLRKVFNHDCIELRPIQAICSRLRGEVDMALVRRVVLYPVVVVAVCLNPEAAFGFLGALARASQLVCMYVYAVVTS